MLTPTRLVLARKRRGISAVELARRVDITNQSISNFERGREVPSDKTLARIAGELGFPLAFFSQPDVEQIYQEQVSFRARSKIPARPRDAALSAATMAVEIHAWIEGRFHLPEVDVPTLERHTPEQAAEFVRARWGIPESRPAPNMVHLLEAHGVRVFSLAPEYSEVDAFSFWRDGTPFVVLNTLKSGERGRFDAAHELGHLVLHGHNGCQSWPKESEKEANQFASTFLIPKESLKGRIGLNPTTDQVLRAKKYWRVAALALTYRLNDLGMFTDWNYKRCIIELGKLGYRSAEPDGIRRETSQLLEKVFSELRKSGVTKGDLANDLKYSTHDLNLLMFGLVMTSFEGPAIGSAEPYARPSLTLVKDTPIQNLAVHPTVGNVIARRGRRAPL